MAIINQINLNLISPHKEFWASEENYLILNPTFSEQQKTYSQKIFEENGHLKSHIYIASSGTTSLSLEDIKLIAISKAAFLASAKSVNDILAAEQDDTWVNVLPHYHVGGLSIYARAFLKESIVVNGYKHSEAQNKWNASFFVDTIENYGGNFTSLVPTQIYDIVSQTLRAPEGLKAVLVGGAAISESLYQAGRRLGWPLLPTFGMTEVASSIATAELDSFSTFAYPKLKILPHITAELDASKKLKLKAPSLCTAILHSDKNKNKYFQSGDWLQTEDFAEIENGFLTPRGRESDIVKISGEAINMQELRNKLEQLMTAYPDWNQLMTIVTQPDSRKGLRIVCAYHKDLPPGDVQLIINQLNQGLRSIEKVEDLVPVMYIPVTDLGKIKVRELQIKISQEIE